MPKLIEAAKKAFRSPFSPKAETWQRCGKQERAARSGAQLRFWNKRYNFAAGAPLALLECGENRLDIEAMLGGEFLTDTPDFIGNWILAHGLFSHELFRCADYRTIVALLPADQGK
jgi:hypothetical protein